jgi:hypothetical protein
MHTKLLNLGFRRVGDKYICEDVVVEIHGDKVYIPLWNMEVTISELEELLLNS